MTAKDHKIIVFFVIFVAEPFVTVVARILSS